MKLLFYSGGWARKNESLDAELQSLLGKNATITYIPSSGESGAVYFKRFQRDRAKLKAKIIHYFPIDGPVSSSELKKVLKSDAIFLSGGNTFYFLHHLRRAGLIPKLKAFAARGGVLFGVSAGSILMTRAITMAGLVPGEADENAVGLRRLSALGLVDFEVYPHFNGSSGSRRALRKYSKASGRKVFAFPDGSGVSVVGDRLGFHGKVTCFTEGFEFELS